MGSETAHLSSNTYQRKPTVNRKKKFHDLNSSNIIYIHSVAFWRIFCRHFLHNILKLRFFVECGILTIFLSTLQNNILMNFTFFCCCEPEKTITFFCCRIKGAYNAMEWNNFWRHILVFIGLYFHEIFIKQLLW